MTKPDSHTTLSEREGKNWRLLVPMQMRSPCCGEHPPFSAWDAVRVAVTRNQLLAEGWFCQLNGNRVHQFLPMALRHRIW